MAVTPQTDLYLLKCPIEADNRNQMNFASKSAQQAYFQSLNKIGFDNFTYQRHDDTIRIPDHIDNLIGFNYVMYRNDNYSSKWFYAFITGMTYVSDHMTLVTIQTDVYQTWQFDMVFKPSFVEREHVNDDTFGKHTIPEGIEYGEYIVNSATNASYSTSLSNCYVVVQVSDLCQNMFHMIGSRKRVYNGIPQGCWLIGLDLSTDFDNLNNMVRSYDYENKADAIVSIGIVPKAMFGASEPIIFEFETQYVFAGFVFPASTEAIELETMTVSKPASIDGYTPKNNKVLGSPYSYLMLSNNGGSDVCYAWEDFSSNSATFKIRGSLSQGCDIKATPSNYKKTNLNGGYEWSVSSQKFPMISWNSNFYLNWVAVNGKAQEIQAGLTGASFASNFLGGLFGGNVGNMLNAGTSLVSSVAQQAQQIREAEMTPNSAKGNTNTGDLNYTLGKTTFTAYKMTIKAEYAKTVDDFFSMFGYKVNSLKVPNLTGRQNWNYVKTAGANIEGNIPQVDVEELKSIFNNGVTIWHNPTNYLDYTKSNNIVS